MSNLEWSERESNKMMDIFTERCIQGLLAKEKRWKKMSARNIYDTTSNKSDWILNATEATHYGFADGIR